MASKDDEVNWREALASAIESHRRHDLAEWELHLIGRRVEAALNVLPAETE